MVFFERNRSKVQISNTELNIRLANVTIRAAGRAKSTADRIINETDDLSVKEAALLFKIYGISALYKASFITDPLAAYFDNWSLFKQLIFYYKEGEGKTCFYVEIQAFCQ